MYDFTFVEEDSAYKLAYGSCIQKYGNNKVGDDSKPTVGLLVNDLGMKKDCIVPANGFYGCILEPWHVSTFHAYVTIEVDLKGFGKIDACVSVEERLSRVLVV